MSQMQNVSGTVNRRAVVIFIAGMLCFWASMYVFVPVFPVYAEKMGAPLNIVGLAVGAYGLTQMLLRIPVGIWSDSIGRRRRFVVAGMMICAISGAGLALAPNPFWLVIFRGVMGISAATWVCSTVLFVSYFPPGNSSVPLAIMSFTSSIGQVLATSAGGILAEVGGWAAPFWVSVGLSLIAGVILLFAPEDHTTASINVSLKWMTQIVQAPLLLLASGVGIILYFATTSTVLGFTPVLAERLGATRTELGLLTAAALLSCGIATLFAPRLIRLLGVRAALLTGLAVVMLAILATPFVPNIGLLALLQVVGGSGRGLLLPMLMNLAIQAVTARHRASAMGIFQAAYAFGMFIGPLTSGVVADLMGLDAVFILCGGLCLIGLVATFLAAGRSELRHALGVSGAVG
jgi:MFS family permease